MQVYTEAMWWRKGRQSAHLGKDSSTAQYLNKTKSIAIPKRRKTGRSAKLKLTGCHGPQLQNVDLVIPLGTFTCVSGISGSGKSSLINQTLYPALHNHYSKETQAPALQETDGLQHLDKVIAINQSPIGRTPRAIPPPTPGSSMKSVPCLPSCLKQPYVYKPGRFSFNVAGGRCEECKGAGLKTVEMNFLLTYT